MRFLIVAVLLISSSIAADAKAVWRHYPHFVQQVAFAYVGPGNALWRVYRAQVTPPVQATKSTPPVAAAPKPVAAPTPAPMVLLAPSIVAKPLVTTPPPPPVVAKPAEPVTVAKASESPATMSMAEPAQAEGNPWRAWVRAAVAAAIAAIAVAMVISGLTRRRRARAAVV